MGLNSNEQNYQDVVQTLIDKWASRASKWTHFARDEDKDVP
jgi:hypothetical protein